MKYILSTILDYTSMIADLNEIRNAIKDDSYTTGDLYGKALNYIDSLIEILKQSDAEQSQATN